MIAVGLICVRNSGAIIAGITHTITVAVGIIRIGYFRAGVDFFRDIVFVWVVRRRGPIPSAPGAFVNHPIAVVVAAVTGDFGYRYSSFLRCAPEMSDFVHPLLWVAVITVPIIAHHTSFGIIFHINAGGNSFIGVSQMVAIAISKSHGTGPHAVVKIVAVIIIADITSWTVACPFIWL